MKKTYFFRLILILSLIISSKYSNLAFSSEKVISSSNSTIQSEVNKDDHKVLAMMNCGLNAETSKVGDQYTARTLEDITYNNCIIIPSGSIVSGEVMKVSQLKRMNRSASMKLVVNSIKTPCGQTICLQGWNIATLVSTPYNKDLKTRAYQRTPATIVASGTSIPLNHASNLNGGVVYVISVGAAATVGFISGAISPDYCKSRTTSAFVRAFESTPLGNTVLPFVKGKNVEIKPGDCIILDINNNILAGIQQQYTCPAQK